MATYILIHLFLHLFLLLLSDFLETRVGFQGPLELNTSEFSYSEARELGFLPPVVCQPLARGCPGDTEHQDPPRLPMP